MNKEAFATALNGTDWASIEDLAALAMDSGEIVTEEDREEAVLRSTKAAIRQYMKSATDANGEPLYHSIQQVQPDGSTVRVYKQEDLFDGTDYQQVINDHVKRAEYHVKRSLRMKERAEEKGFDADVPAIFEQLLMEV